MDLTAQLELGELRLRTLVPDDADLLVEATRQEQGPALWGPRPAGPYSLDDARTALQQWDPAGGEQISYGVLRADRLVAAVGLMLDSPRSAEVAYWVRPEQRRQGIGVRSVRALTASAHRDGGLARLWLEIDPANTASQELARRAGYQLEQRLPRHCRAWLEDDPARDQWHDCLIFAHAGPGARETQMLTTVRIGGIEVVSLLDGVEDLDDHDILDPSHGPSDPVWEPFRSLYPAVFAADGGWRAHVRATLLRAHGRTVLVDTGVGGPSSPAMSWYPAAGRLLGALAESGTAPAEVEVVVLTHVHDDHIGGTVTAEGAPAFPNARYVVNRIDRDWLEELAGKTEEDRAIWDRLLAPLESSGVLQAVDGDYQVLPGIHARHRPGHTPGHQVVEVSDGGASLLLSGDAINHPAQLQRPELATGPDEDAEGALRMRRMLLAELVDSDRVLAPSHFAEPFGRVVSDGPAGVISWVPVV